MMDPYQRLADAIVLQAVKDYRQDLRRMKNRPSNINIGKVKEDERFFRSSWFKTLSKIDGKYIIEKLREECL
ncbi:MAG: hypothetical protein LKE59_10590 [Eubacterium sp.]|nr:hypothetical protein [Eubacterium sp.]MCH4078599.1 hypothetical protein [Eubacterium sp.]MCH4109740.1 hypothetical protein [Eubacterium sp.]